MNLVETTSIKSHKNMSYTFNYTFISSTQVIQVGFNNMIDVLEGIRNSLSECGSKCFEVERNLSITQGTLRENKRSLVLILQMNWYLFITRKSIHEGKKFNYNACNDNFINK